MNKDNVKGKLNCFLTAQVTGGARMFKIIDGTARPMRNAHVFYQGYTRDKGETVDAFITMGTAIQSFFNTWYAKQKEVVYEFYQEHTL